MEKLSALKSNVLAWMMGKGMRCADIRFYDPDEWGARGEGLGDDAALSAVIDGTDLYRILNGWGLSIDTLTLSFDSMVRHVGYYYELGYEWSVHFYPTTE